MEVQLLITVLCCEGNNQLMAVGLLHFCNFETFPSILSFRTFWKSCRVDAIWQVSSLWIVSLSYMPKQLQWQEFCSLAMGPFLLPTNRTPRIEICYNGHGGSPSLLPRFPLLCCSSLWALYQMVTWNESTGFGKHSVSCANTFMSCVCCVLWSPSISCFKPVTLTGYTAEVVSFQTLTLYGSCNGLNWK